MKILCATLILMSLPGFCLAQAGGNVGYSQSGGPRAEQNERLKRALTREEMPPNGKSMFLDASVLMNVQAEEYVAIFGLMQEGATLAECGQKMDATINAFSDAIKAHQGSVSITL